MQGKKPRWERVLELEHSRNLRTILITPQFHIGKMEFEPEERQRLLTFRNMQRDMATLFGDFRMGLRRTYPDVVLQRVAAEMYADPDDLLAERNRPVRRGWPWNQLPSQRNNEMVNLQAQTWKRFWRRRFQGHNVDDDVPIQVGAGRVRKLLRSKGMNARMVKVLGSGGQGMVSLWEIETRRQWKRVVIKSTALEGAVLAREKGTTLVRRDITKSQ